MPLDGITANFLAKELSEKLKFARVEKIFQKNSFDIYLKLRTQNENFVLIMSANPSSPRIHITTEEISNPFTPLRFCTVLRKHLSGARILAVETDGFERIFSITFQTINELGDRSSKYIFAEIMGRHSNIILLNENKVIIDSALHIDNKTSSIREVLPARKYISPPMQNKMSPFQALKALNEGRFTFKEDSRVFNIIIDSIIGFSPAFSKQICYEADIEPDIIFSHLESADLNKLMHVLKYYLELIESGKYTPCVIYSSNLFTEPLDFHAYRFTRIKYYKTFDTISQSMDMFYLYKTMQNDFNQKQDYLLKVVSKKINSVQNKILIQIEELKECKNASEFKKYGDLILSNLHLIKDKSEKVIVSDFFECPPTDILIPLNPSYSGSKNAQIYYKKYSKLQMRNEYLSKTLKKESEELDYLKSIASSLQSAENLDDLNAVREELKEINLSGDREKTKSFGKNKKTDLTNRPLEPRKFITDDGFEILVGRNNYQNDRLSLKTASSDDIWFHLQKQPGTHVILRTNQRKPSENALTAAACLAAWYSKNKKVDIYGNSVNVDYCLAKDVWKPKGSSPGHVLYKNFKTIYAKTILPENVSLK